MNIQNKDQLVEESQALQKKYDSLKVRYTALKFEINLLMDDLRILKESESIGGLGSYIFDIKNGTWKSSEILDTIFGIEKNYIHRLEGWIDLIHPEWKELMTNYLMIEILGNHNLFNKEYKIIRKSDNAERWVHGHGRLEFDSDGNLTYMLGTIIDITEHKLVEQDLQEKNNEIAAQNEEYATLNEELNQVNDKLIGKRAIIEENSKMLKEAQLVGGVGSYVFDIKNGVWTSSEMADIVFGIDDNYVRSVSGWVELIHPDFKEEMTNYLALEILQKHNRFDKEYKTVRISDGQTRWVHGTGRIEFDKQGNPDKLIGTIMDITKRKNAELLLEEKNSEIESQNEEYKQLNEELIAAKQRAEESDRLKTAFLANINHEIRTPMNSIIGFSQLLLKPNLSPEKKQSFVEIINTNTHQLLGIINDIIDISKIEAGQIKVNMDTVYLPILFADMEKMMRPLAMNKKLSISYTQSLSEEQSQIHTDNIKLRQILSNLLTNAIKFTEKGKVEYGCTLQKNYFEFFVRDTGIGIPHDKANTIFERFCQLENQPAESLTGTGLGLAICKAYVELLGGKIWLTSEVGSGTTFYFTIPNTATMNKQKEIKHSHLKTYNWNSKTILIADDDFLNVAYLEEEFSETGATLIHAENGQIAIDLVKLNPAIDLIMLDLRMPVLGGIEATAEIRKFNQKTPILIQSAYTFSEEECQCKLSGTDGFISKPIIIEKLMQMVDEFLPKT